MGLCRFKEEHRAFQEVRIVLECGYLACAACAAWFIALLFIKKRMTASLVHSVSAGLVCGAAAYLLDRFGLAGWTVPACALLFVLSALVLLLMEKEYKGNSAIALLLAFAGFFALIIPLSAYIYIGVTSVCMGAVLIFFFVAAALLLRGRFPGSDWRSAYSEKDKERVRLQRVLMYVVPLIMCAALALAVLLPKTGPSYAFFALSVVSSALYWFGIWLLILIPAYRKERSAIMEEKQYREDMQSFMNVIRSQRHDYNFHVQTISGLIRQGKVDECLKYVNALEEDSAIMNSILPVKDPAVSALIHNFRVLAVREGIALNIDIQYDMSQIATNVYETNKIISNLLQNAIDEVSTHEDKSFGIHLTVIKRGEYCVIRVSNKLKRVPDANELGEVFKQGYTTKQGHDGVGLSSLKTLLARYHGAIYTQLEDDVISFIARVPINYAKDVIS